MNRRLLRRHLQLDATQLILLSQKHPSRHMQGQSTCNNNYSHSANRSMHVPATVQKRQGPLQQHGDPYRWPTIEEEVEKKAMHTAHRPAAPWVELWPGPGTLPLPVNMVNTLQRFNNAM